MFVFSVVLSVINLFLWTTTQHVIEHSLFRIVSDSEGYSTSRMVNAFFDPNPIEMWGCFGEASCSSKLSSENKNTVIRALTEEWDKLPQQLLDNVVQIMKGLMRFSSVTCTTVSVASWEADITGAKPMLYVMIMESLRHLDAFNKGRIIWEVGRRPQCDKDGCKSSELLTASFHDFWRQFQTTGTAIRGFSSGRRGGTTPADDGTLSYRPEETGDEQREKSLDTDTGDWTTDISFYRGKDCTVVVCLHDALYGVYL
ncbi:hypothetical protein TNCV_2969581 [Trichonephila clavipes]|nr:hypothetical protein TNCV_2969581 [Trichonephila clavipes]